MEFLFTARMPELVKQLRRYTSNLSKGLNNFENSLEYIENQLARCKANLKSVKSKVSGDSKKSATRAYNLVKNQDGVSLYSKEEIRKIYRELLTLTDELQNLVEDKKWSPKHGA